MGQLRNANAQDRNAFPGAIFAVQNTPPITQCREPPISQLAVTSIAGQPTLDKPNGWPNVDLAGKKCTIQVPVPNEGIYTILSNTDDQLILTTNLAASSGANNPLVHDFAGTFITRSVPSFIRHIESEGKAHTCKGGQLYTNIENAPMSGACSVTFDPQ